MVTEAANGVGMVWTYVIVLGLGLAAGWGLGRQLSRRSHPEPVSVTPQPSDVISPEPLPLKDGGSASQALHQAQLNYRSAINLAQFKAGFLARTSHELRSPLNGIISLHQLILADLCDSPDEEREFVKQAHDSAKKMLALLDEVTYVSKLEHGTASLRLEPLLLSEVLGEVKTLTHLQAQNRNLRLEIDSLDPDLYVWGDRRLLRQVLLNLVTTPIYLMDEGYIRVTTAVDAATQQAQVVVHDQRPASSWHEPVDLMEAAHSETDAGVPGDRPAELSPGMAAGLKLMLSQQLIELMQGTITVLDTPLSVAHDPAAQVWTRIQCSVAIAPDAAVS